MNKNNLHDSKIGSPLRNSKNMKKKIEITLNCFKMRKQKPKKFNLLASA